MSNGSDRRLKGLLDGQSGSSPLWGGYPTDPDYLQGYSTGAAKKLVKEQEAQTQALRDMQHSQEQHYRDLRDQERARERAERERRLEEQRFEAKLERLKKTAKDFIARAGDDSLNAMTGRQVSQWIRDRERVYYKLTDEREDAGIADDGEQDRIEEAIQQYRAKYSQCCDALAAAFKAAKLIRAAPMAVSSSFEVMSHAGVCDLVLYFLHDHALAARHLDGSTPSIYIDDKGRFVGQHQDAIRQSPEIPASLSALIGQLEASESILVGWSSSDALPEDVASALTRLQHIAGQSSKLTMTEAIPPGFSESIDKFDFQGVPAVIADHSFLRHLESDSTHTFLGAALELTRCLLQLAKDVRTASAWRSNPLTDGEIKFPGWRLLRTCHFSDVVASPLPTWPGELADTTTKLRAAVSELDPSSNGFEAAGIKVRRLGGDIDAIFKAHSGRKSPLADWPEHLIVLQRAKKAKRLGMRVFYGTIAILLLNTLAKSAAPSIAVYGATLWMLALAAGALATTAGFKSRVEAVKASMGKVLDEITALAGVLVKRMEL